MEIRLERSEDIPAIRDLIGHAFRSISHSDQTEAAIVDRLRSAGALTLSLVAVDGDVVGHVAFSPVSIEGATGDWYGLAPLAVRPGRQGRGIGNALVREGLERLRAAGARGCVLLGEPDYYARFGFKTFPGLTLANVPPEYFLAFAFGGDHPEGSVLYHPAFGVS